MLQHAVGCFRDAVEVEMLMGYVYATTYEVGGAPTEVGFENIHRSPGGRRALRPFEITTKVRVSERATVRRR